MTEYDGHKNGAEEYDPNHRPDVAEAIIQNQRIVADSLTRALALEALLDAEGPFLGVLGSAAAEAVVAADKVQSGAQVDSTLLPSLETEQMTSKLAEVLFASLDTTHLSQRELVEIALRALVMTASVAADSGYRHYNTLMAQEAAEAPTAGGYPYDHRQAEPDEIAADMHALYPEGIRIGSGLIVTVVNPNLNQPDQPISNE